MSPTRSGSCRETCFRKRRKEEEGTREEEEEEKQEEGERRRGFNATPLTASLHYTQPK